jgi:hypothetical protein
MELAKAKYPYGKCANCGVEFDSYLRDKQVSHCPWCGEPILDYINDRQLSISPDKVDSNKFIYCEECGTRIYERTGKDLEGGDWIDLGAGVCSGLCERELCGNCAQWDANGECEMCRNSPCGQCPNHNVVEMCKKCDHLEERKKWSGYKNDMDGECNVCPKKCSDTKDCKNPCVDCPDRDKCLNDDTDTRNKCTDFNNFLDERIAGYTSKGETVMELAKKIEETYAELENILNKVFNGIGYELSGSCLVSSMDGKPVITMTIKEKGNGDI